MYHIYIETMSSYVRCLVSTGNHRIEIHTLNVMIHNGGKLNLVYAIGIDFDLAFAVLCAAFWPLLKFLHLSIMFLIS